MLQSAECFSLRFRTEVVHGEPNAHGGIKASATFPVPQASLRPPVYLYYLIRSRNVAGGDL
jgi:hypothetical protein